MWVGCILLRGDKWVKVFPSTQLVSTPNNTPKTQHIQRQQQQKTL
jgi:hypothetical protein